MDVKTLDARQKIFAAVCLLGTVALLAAALWVPVQDTGENLRVAPATHQDLAAPASQPVDTNEKDARVVPFNNPLRFEVNAGQTDEQVKYLARGPGYNLFITEQEAVLSLSRSAKDSVDAPAQAVIRMRPVAANAAPTISGQDKLASVSHYYKGNDPAKWRTNVAHYAKVTCEDVYPGIDMVYYGNENRLEFDFVVKAGIDPACVKIAFEGAENLELKDNEILVHAPGGLLHLRKPLVYQNEGNLRVPVAAEYTLTSENEVAFTLAAYDIQKALVIDPIVDYASYLGGGSSDSACAIALDKDYNTDDPHAVLVGSTYSTDFPLVGSPISSVLNGDGTSGPADAFVTMFNNNGSNLLYSTYLGGCCDDVALGVAVCPAGNIYVTGWTNCSESDPFPFPLLNEYDGTLGGSQDAFATMLSWNGQLISSTYLGGAGADQGNGIAVDDQGSAYVTGWTQSGDFPTVNPIQGSLNGTQDAFVTKLNMVTNTISVPFSTYHGGTGNEDGKDIAIKKNYGPYLGREIFVTGYTTSSDDSLPLANANQATFQGGVDDAFVAKIVLTSTNILDYSTYLGGTGSDHGYSVDVDRYGYAYVAGGTDSPVNFPIFTPLQGSKAAGWDSFVSRFKNDGTLNFSTFWGGDGNDYAQGIAVNDAREVAITGYTGSSDFPMVDPMQSSLSTAPDTFAANFSMITSTVIPRFSTYLGGTSSDYADDVAMDHEGGVYVTGTSYSGDFSPTNSSSYQQSLNGTSDAYLYKLEPSMGVITSACRTLIGGPEVSRYRIVGSSGIYTERTGHAPDLGDLESPVDFRAYSWDRPNQTYKEQTKQEIQDKDSRHHDSAKFVIFRENFLMEFVGEEGGTSAFTRLYPGWNMVEYPFSTNYVCMTLDCWIERPAISGYGTGDFIPVGSGQTGTLLDFVFYHWTGTSGYASTCDLGDVLVPGGDDPLVGAWIYLKHDKPLEFMFVNNGGGQKPRGKMKLLGKDDRQPPGPPSAGPGDSESGGCFIATAAHASYHSPAVRMLRGFRDTHLAASTPGHDLIRTYYTASPPIADKMRASEILRALVRDNLIN